MLTLAVSTVAANANPIVFLHGWNSAGDLWDSIRALAATPVADGGMGIAADDMIALSYYATSGDYALGCSVYTPIQEVATNAARVIKAFQQKKACQSTSSAIRWAVSCSARWSPTALSTPTSCAATSLSELLTTARTPT